MSVYLSLGEAARQVTVTKSTLHRAIRDGRLSANRDEQGHYQIDPAELFRVFDPIPRDGERNNVEQSRNTLRDDAIRVSEHSGTGGTPASDESTRWFQQQIEELQEEAADLRKENQEKDERLNELRVAMAALPSPESVQAEKERLEREHTERLEKQKEAHALMLAREQNQNAKAVALEKARQEKLAADIRKKESQWKNAFADRKQEIEQARQESEAIRHQAEEERKRGELLTRQIKAMESRGLVARLLNRKPKMSTAE